MGHRIHELKASGRCLESIGTINQGEAKSCKKWDKAFFDELGKESQGEEKENLGEDKQAY